MFCIFWTTNKCLSIMMSLFMLSLILCKSCFIFELRLNGLSLHVQNFIVIGPLLNMSKKPSPIRVNAKASKPLQEELATISWSSKGVKSISGTIVHFFSQIVIFLFGFEAKFVTLYSNKTKVIPKSGPDGFVH